MIGSLVVSTGCVTVNDGTAKAHMIGGVAVAANGSVSPGQNKLVGTFIAGLAKNGDTLPNSESSLIIEKLLMESVDPVAIDQPFENRLDHVLLVAREEIAANGGRGNPPVVGDIFAKQTTLSVLMVPIKADDISLSFAQGAVKSADQRFGRCPGRRVTQNRRKPASGCYCCGRKGSGLQKASPILLSWGIRVEHVESLRLVVNRFEAFSKVEGKPSIKFLESTVFAS